MSITFSEKTFHFLVSLTFIQKIKVVKKKKRLQPTQAQQEPPSRSLHTRCVQVPEQQAGLGTRRQQPP